MTGMTGMTGYFKKMEIKRGYQITKSKNPKKPVIPVIPVIKKKTPLKKITL